jgi:polyhydroxyalkanoate synthesis repressor PhaR
MPLIKRYPNRKLYDTNAKQYITLAGIAALIRNGDEVHVVDNATGEDLTAITLTQVIAEQEKKQGGHLSGTVLADLIQAGSDKINSFQKNLISQLGILHLADDEIRRRIQLLIQKGELAEAEGQHLIEKLVEPDVGFSPLRRAMLEHEIEGILQKRAIPTREDLELILDQLDTLSNELEKLSKK